MTKFRLGIIAALLLVLCSRIPFIFDGYGSEEDAWALPLVAERIGVTGIYEVSRLPGHPLQEMVYACIWDKGPVVFNLLTVIISTTAIGFFIFGLKRLDLKYPVITGLLTAFTPAFYINSTNDMDYTWATGLILISFWAVSRRKPITAGVFIAMAIGCRITSAAMLLPLGFLLFRLGEEYKRRQLTLFLTACLLTAFVLFIPVFRNYGLSFFTYYEHFPIPGFAKNFYKAVPAVWGIPLLLMMLLVFISILAGKRKNIFNKQNQFTAHHQSVFITCIIVIFLTVIAFIRVPLKSAFMIPLIPFFWTATAMFCSEKQMQWLLAGSVLSCFFAGVNLDDPLRGSAVSRYSYHADIAGQPVAFDVLEGLVPADQSKRIQRTAYARKVLQEASYLKNQSVILAGWWLADLLVLEKSHPLQQVTFRYYTQEDTLKMYRLNNIPVYYLPQQDSFNDLRFKGHFTNKYAIPLPGSFP